MMMQLDSKTKEFYNIVHRPILETKVVCKIYSEKDGVPIKYVCTSSISARGGHGDIFYRDTPHPEFGNRYFTLFHSRLGLSIANADNIENLEFGMIGDNDGKLYYSAHVHDFFYVGDAFIDGGRDYVRTGGYTRPKVIYFKIVDGEFVLQ